MLTLIVFLTIGILIILSIGFAVGDRDTINFSILGLILLSCIGWFIYCIDFLFLN